MEIILTIAKWLTAIGGIGGFLIGLYKIIRTIEKIKEQLDERLTKNETTMEEMKEHIDNRLIEIDTSACKNFLVRFLKDVEQGIPIDEVEVARAHEVYEHYIKDLHANSYIHSKWEKLMK